MDRQHDSWTRWHATHQVARRIVLHLLAAGALTGSFSGCQIVIGVLALINGFPTQDADFKRHTKKEMNEKGKKVVVLCTSPEKAKGGYSSLDVDVITEVSRRMKEHKIDVVNGNKIASWIDDNGGILEEADVLEIGRIFEADYIVSVELTDFGIQEENSPGLYRGHAQGTVSVLAMQSGKNPKEKRPGKTIYSKAFSSTYPRHQPISSEHVSAPVFRKQYLDRVSDEVARLFYDHRPGEEF